MYLIPRLQVSWNTDSEVAKLTLSTLCLQVVRPGVGHRPVHVWRRRRRGKGVVVDTERGAVARGQIDVSATHRADHHRLDDAESEHSGDGGVNGVATHGQHLEAGCRTKWMVGDDHASAAGSRLLVGVELRSGSCAPIGHGSTLTSPHDKTSPVRACYELARRIRSPWRSSMDLNTLKDYVTELSAWAHVATVGADGEPDVVPIHPCWEGETLWFMGGEGSVKGKNVARQQQGCFALAGDRERQRR